MGLKDIHNLDYAVVLGEHRVETRAFYKDVLDFALEHDSEGKVSFRVGATLPIRKLEKYQRKIRRPTNPALAVVRECPACLFMATGRRKARLAPIFSSAYASTGIRWLGRP